MNLSKLFPLLFCCLISLTSTSAQNQTDTDRAAINSILDQLFNSMEKADTSGLAALFHIDAMLNTVYRDVATGKTEIGAAAIARWMTGISRAQPGALKETLYSVEIRIDGDMATAWTPYRFDLNGEVSHCGVNSFHFVRAAKDGGWLISGVVDTRRKEGCPDLPTGTEEERLNALADAWHKAAADADSAAYFGMMDAQSVFIGTDASEHWTRDQFIEFAAPYFAKGEAWSFTAIERHTFVSPDSPLVYWDELLDTWMGPCRGTGIAERQFDGSYLIKHYTLSVTIDNDKIQGFIDLVKE